MNLYKKRPEHVQAQQWFKHGDVIEVQAGPMMIRQFAMDMDTHEQFPMPPRYVPIDPSHGWLDDGENSHEVLPGYYVAKVRGGIFSLCKPDVFERLYVQVEVIDVEFEEILTRVPNENRIYGNAGGDDQGTDGSVPKDPNIPG